MIGFILGWIVGRWFLRHHNEEWVSFEPTYDYWTPSYDDDSALQEKSNG